LDGTVRLWDGETGEIRRSLSGSGGYVLSLSWSPSGRELASGSSDGTVRLWDSETGELLAIFQAWEEMGLTTVPGGWFLHSPRSQPLDPHRLRLLVARPGPTPDRCWHVLPLGGLGRYLESPERVRAALAGERQPPAVLPGPMKAATPKKTRRAPR
jgi:WD40 repeat protein